MRECLEDMLIDSMHDFDRSYFERLGEKRGHFLRCLIKDSYFIDLNGTMNELVNERGRQYLHISNHKSHFDYLQQLYHFWQYNLEPPRIAARENVFIPFLGKLWKKCGAFKLPFNNIKVSEARVLKKIFRLILGNGESIMIYPEGGRSYSGQIKPFSEWETAGVRLICKTAENLGINLKVVPHYITYDKAIEKEYFPLLRFLKERNRFLYQAVDISAFALRVFSRNGKVLHMMGRPFYINECEDGKEVCQRAYEEIILLRNKGLEFGFS